jgi:hypothetical protein
MKIQFHPTITGALLIDDKPAGDYDGNTYTPAEGLAKREINAVTKFLRSKAKEDAEEKPGDSPGDATANAPAPSETFTAAKVKQAQEILRSCPIPHDPMMGDKTPAVVEWYRDNDPAEFARRYHGRKTHLGRI